jgi:O-glycosyl hydrolase
VWWIALLSLLLGGAGNALFAQTELTATVDPTYVVVTNFDGWGTSLCWWANVCGGYANRNTYASLAFTTLKLNIVRYNIGGGENPNIANTMEYRAQMPGFEPTNGVWNWSADANQRWMLKQALALGANRVVAFANSPPWWMTVSGSVTGAPGGTNNLQTAYETNFAAYLATVISNLTVLDGDHFDFTTPMNEPTGTWWVYGGSQEGCHMDAGQQARVVNDLQAALNARNLTAGIDASEDNDEQDTINSVGAYGSAQSNVALVASHTYGANNPGGLADLAAGLHRPEWVSEYGDSDGTGITMARRIHDDIAQAWARAWIYWQVVDNSGGWGFLYNPLDGSGNTAYTINKKFYVMGQFSEYIRPGCEIFNVNDDYSLAAYNPTNRTLTIVAVNDTTNSLTINYNLGAFTNLPADVSATRTSPTESLAPISAIPLQNRLFTATLIPQSVTTFVLTNAVTAPPGSSPVAWYPFEGNANDASGNGNNGTLNNVTFTTGKLGAYAAQFNGSNSYVQIPLVVSNDFTIAFWLKTTGSASSGQWWDGKGLVDGEVPGTVNDFGVSLVGTKVGLGIGNPDTTVTTTNAANDGQWHHVAATRDAVSGQMLVYVDGVLQAAGYGPLGTRTAPPALRIGSIQAGYSGGFFSGAIDDVQLFTRVFAAAEIPSLMNHPPAITSPGGSYSILAGRTLTITNTATDPDLPAQTLTWSLLSPPGGAGINASSGLLTWRPTVAQSPSTNTLTVQVADNGTPVMTATQSLQVTVLAPAAPQLAAAASGKSNFTFSVNGDLGPNYAVLSSTNLLNWSVLFVTNPVSMPFGISVTNPPGQTFYRLELQ